MADSKEIRRNSEMVRPVMIVKKLVGGEQTSFCPSVEVGEKHAISSASFDK